MREDSSTKIGIFNIYIYLILLMPLTTLIQEHIDSINRLLFVVIFLVQIILLVGKPIKRSAFLILLTALFVYVIGLINTENLAFENSIVYYINWIIYVCIIIAYKKEFLDCIYTSKTFIYVIVNLWTVAVFVSIFLPSSYYVKEGGERYFGSFAGNIFRLGPTALFIATLAVVIMVAYKERRAILYMILPLYCGFMGSSRTYFVVIVITCVIGLYCFSKSKKQFVLLLGICVALGIVAYGASAMAVKVAHTTDDSGYGDIWFRVTSGRSEIWANVMNAFNRLPIFNKLLGAGYSFSVSAADIRSHNDFIEVLAIHGYAGLILYVYSMYVLFKNSVMKHTPKILIFLCVGLWSFNAMFNMFYYYICAAFSFPFILMALNIYMENKRMEDANQK